MMMTSESSYWKQKQAYENYFNHIKCRTIVASRRVNMIHQKIND